MVHSNGANNPTLRRYVGPDDGLLCKNQYNNHWNQYKPDVTTAKDGMGQWSGTAATSAERSSGNVITNLTAKNALHCKHRNEPAMCTEKIRQVAGRACQ